jgi:hypothetical protein
MGSPLPLTNIQPIEATHMERAAIKRCEIGLTSALPGRKGGTPRCLGSRVTVVLYLT